MDLSSMSLAELLAHRAAIDAEIQGRGHARTATSLQGELMERVVANAYDGALAPPTTKSIDVISRDGLGIQVKRRSLPAGDMRFWSFKIDGYQHPTGLRTYASTQWAVPTVGSASRDLHPLMTWWMVLYALSMLARYHPREWTALLSLGTNREASRIEFLLDSALVSVPELIAVCLQRLEA